MRCPHCGCENSSASNVCEICGRPLQQYRRPSPSASASQRQSGATGRRPLNRQRQPYAATRRPVNAQRPANPAQRRPAANGARQGQALRRQPKTRWNPKFLAACALILCFIILVPILIAVHAHRGDSIESKRIQMFYSGTTQKTSIVLSGNIFDKTISGKIDRTSSSDDGMEQAALTESGELYYITQEKLVPVAKSVKHFVLSADGTRLAYVVETAPEPSDTSESSTEEEETEDVRSSLADEELSTESTTEYVPAGAQDYLGYPNTSLFLYNSADASAPIIANHVSCDSVSLSPCGESLAYTVSDENGESFEGYYFNLTKKESKSIGRNALPIAVSDDASRFYYVKYDKIEDVWVQKLFAKFADTDVKLGEFADGKRLSVYLNRDYTQLVFSITGKSGNYFLYTTDKDKEKLSVGFSPIYPYGQREVSSGKAVITPLTTFAKTVFTDASGHVQRIDGKLVCTDTGAVGKYFRITPDGKVLYYLDNNEHLYSCTVRKNDRKEVAARVLSFELSCDGEVLYYVNSDNELHCIKGGKNIRAAENVYSSKGGGGLTVTDGGYLYYLKDYTLGSGTLCYIKGVGSEHVLSDYNDVHDIAADVGEYIYFRSHYNSITGTYQLYYGKTKKYTQLFDRMG